VLQLQFPVGFAEEGKWQMFCSTQQRDGLTQNQLSTDSITIQNGEPRFLQNHLGQTDECSDAESENDKRRGSTRHSRRRIDHRDNRIKQQSTCQSTQASADETIANLTG